MLGHRKLLQNLCFVFLYETAVDFRPSSYTTDIPQLVGVLGKRSTFDFTNKIYATHPEEVILVSGNNTLVQVGPRIAGWMVYQLRTAPNKW